MLKTWIAMLGLSVVWIAGRSSQLELWNGETPLQEVLHQLGENCPNHYLQLDSTMVKMGEELVKHGPQSGRMGSAPNTSASTTSAPLATTWKSKTPTSG